MKVSKLEIEKITDELVDRVLYSGMNYENQYLHVAIILGSAKAHLYRVPYAVAEYKNGRVDKIIISGGDRVINGTVMNEAEYLKAAALEMGVEESDIIVENRAQTTLENLQFSREIIKSQGMIETNINVGIVTTAFHMRRSLMMARRIFAKDDVNIIPLPGQDNSTRRDTWYKTEKGRNIAIDELKKIIWYVNQGTIDDFEV